MPPTTLLADPSIRLAGVRFGARPPRVRRTPAGRRVSRYGAVLALLAATALVGLAYLGTWPPLATVMSASMDPTIKTGDVVVLQKLKRSPRVGDIVAVDVPSAIRTRYGYPPVIIHRIVGITRDGVVSTKGDAFDKADPFNVPSSALDTRVVATVPAAGRVFAFLGSTLGILWIAGGALLMIGLPVLEHYREGQRRELGDREDTRSVLESVTEELALLRSERDRELDAAAREAAVREQVRAAERDAAVQAAAAAQAELRAANAALALHFAQLPAQIERAIAAAIAGLPAPAPAPAPAAPAAAPTVVRLPRPAPLPPAPRAPSLRRFVPASQFAPPPPTPDLLATLGPSPAATSAPVPWDAAPATARRETLLIA